MRRLLTAAAIAMGVAVLAAGCSDRSSSMAGHGVAPDENAGKLISRFDLTSVLWEEAGKGSPNAGRADARCLATSTFIVRKEAAFLVVKNVHPDNINTTSSMIVSPIAVEINDEEGVVRGAECDTGTLAFTVTANKSIPIDFEESADVQGVTPLGDEASETAVPYNSACDIIAHFEKHGDENCSEEPDEGKAAEAVLERNEECNGLLVVQSFKLVVDTLVYDPSVLKPKE